MSNETTWSYILDGCKKCGDGQMRSMETDRQVKEWMKKKRSDVDGK